MGMWSSGRTDLISWRLLACSERVEYDSTFWECAEWNRKVVDSRLDAKLSEVCWGPWPVSTNESQQKILEDRPEDCAIGVLQILGRRSKEGP